VQICRKSRDLEAFKAALNGVNIANALEEAVSKDWIEGVAWLLSIGAKEQHARRNTTTRVVVLFHAPLEPIIVFTKSLAMVRLLGLHVDSQALNWLQRPKTRLQLLLDAGRVTAVQHAFVIDLIDANARVPLDVPDWVRRIVSGRENCRHIVLMLMQRSKHCAHMMCLIARDVWDTRLDTDAWARWIKTDA
jgi:hypothetical protein